MEGELYNAQEGLEGELGYKGERGYSTYELAVLNGFEGSLQDYLDHYGVDLSNYVSTSDVVDNLTSTTTNYPLSANQGKVLKDTIDTKANANNVYTQEEVNTMLENINGKVLYKRMANSVEVLPYTLEIDTTGYDELEIFAENEYTGLFSFKLIKSDYYTREINKNKPFYVYNSCIPSWDDQMANYKFSIQAYKFQWESNGIKIHYANYMAIEPDGADDYLAVKNMYEGINIKILLVVGRKRNIYSN